MSHFVVCIFFHAFLIVLLANPVTIRAQSEIEQLYRMNFIQFQNDGEVIAGIVNNYMIRMANRELQRLRSGMFDAEYDDPAGILARLEVAMAPLYDPELNPKDHVKSSELWQSAEIANQVYEAMGPDYAERVVLRDLNRTLVEVLKERKRFDNSYLSEKGFKRMLDLSEEQEKTIDEIAMRWDQQLKDMSSRHSVKIAQNSLNRWNAMLAILNVDQRQDAINLIGKPVSLAMDQAEDPLAKESSASYLNGAIFGTRWNKLVATDGRSASQMSDEELRDNGIEVFDTLAYTMLFSKTIQAELELTDEQRSKLRSSEFRADLAERVYARPEGDRMQQLLDGRASYPSVMSVLLLEPQQVWFRQLEFQIRLGAWHASTCGLLSPELSARLSIDQNQRRQIEETAKKFDVIEKQILEARAVESSEGQEKMKNELLAVLDEKQRAIYDSLFPASAESEGNSR